MSEEELIEHVDTYLNLKAEMFQEHFQAWLADRTREYTERFLDKLKSDVAMYIIELYEQPDQASDQ